MPVTSNPSQGARAASSRRPDATASRRADPVPERFGQTLVRRMRDVLIMGVVGPAMGVAAIFAIHEMASMQLSASRAAETARAARESERALAALEDRPMAAANVPTGVAPAPTSDPAPAPAATTVTTLTTASIDPSLVSLAPIPEPRMPAELDVADFGAMTPSPQARQMADWVVSRHDNGRLPFVVLDKHNATLYAFRADGVALESTNVLLGQSRGDDTFPGIGNVPIAQVKPYQRTTAAGRFVTRPGLDEDHTDVVWLDYDAALAMHRVINKVKSEHRLTRIVSKDPNVRRISWGCINIPIDFFDRRISPVFGKHTGIAYVIPETKTFDEVFEQGHAAPAQPVLATAAGATSTAAAMPTPVATANGPSLAPRDIAAR